ncbi:MAG: prepilin-type N-terminal cleavage/methylation domain [Capsulimonas sp.]|jgi:prepilin-type processing-associated H-X9-DG protein|nr:prepilin-type N-terminal cleavage/methylation domain [Capsulimonas sp.]
MRRNAGVSRRDLLAVLAIIGVVTAVLYPVFSKAGSHSGPSPYSNPKQIGLAMLQYAEDNEQYLPPRQAYTGYNHELVSWRRILYPYVKNEAIYQSWENGAAKEPDLEHDGYNRSYAVNSTTVARPGASGPFSDVYGGKSKLQDIKNPAATALLTETTAAYNDINVTLPEAFTSEFGHGKNRGALYAGYQSKSAYLFADGHVKGWKPQDTLSVNGKNLWTRDNSDFSSTETAAASAVLQYSQDHYQEMQRKRGGQQAQ